MFTFLKHLLSFFLLFLLNAVSAEAIVWYVSTDGIIGGDGKSWHDAFHTIENAVLQATSNDEIWVRQGTYTLTLPIVLNMKAPQLYGGFAGGETDRSQRDIKNNATIIDGGGTTQCLHVIWAAPVIDGFTFSNCHAGVLQNGGAILFDGCMEQYPFVANCIFKNNYAGYGGAAIANSYSSPRIVNSIFWNNTAYQGGGGIYNTGYSSPFITNCTFSGNAAWAGGGIHSDGDTTLPAIANSIFWGNTAIHHSPEISGLTGGVTYSDVNQSGFTGNGNIRLDPRFVSPDIGNLHLRNDSPCIDAGSDSAFFLPGNDIDGDPRRVDGNSDGIAKVDMGADEYIPGTTYGIWYVDSARPSSGTGNSWGQAWKTIQEAFNAASNGDEIWVKQGTYNITGTMTLSKNVSVYGGFAGTETQRTQRNWTTNVATVDGVNNTVQCLFIDGSSHNVTAIFDGLTFKRCGSNDSVGGAVRVVSMNDSVHTSASFNNCKFAQNHGFIGGGISISAFSYLSVNNTTFDQNAVPAGSGGGIATTYPSTLVVTDSVFTSNSGKNGSAISNSSNLFMSGSQFSSNATTASDSYGNGAVLNAGYSGYQVIATISDTTFENNTAPMSGGFGGAVYNYYTTLTLTGSTFVSNSAQNGGAIYNGTSSAMTVSNSTFNSNSSVSGGGIYNTSTLTSLSSSLFSGNTASDSGGAITGTSSHPITNTKFIANVAAAMGGAILNSASPSITNCAFLKNRASDGSQGWGGAINNQGGAAHIINCTFSGNYAYYTGGAVFTSSSASAVIRNSILWNDSSGFSDSKEIFDYAANVRYSDVQQDYFDGNGNIYQNPHFVAVSDPDPLKWDVRLQSASPCIDTGDNASIPVGITTDLANRPRTIDGNADFTVVVDMGAYEFFAPDTVPPTCAIQINSGAYATSTTSATLDLTFTMAPFICIKNANTGPCLTSEWLGYYSPVPWTLSSGDGIKTVYVWLRDAAGNVSSAPCSDSIIVDTAPPVNGTLISTEDNGRIILTWPDFSDGTGSGIASYTLVYSTSGPPADCNSGTVLYAGSLTSFVHIVPANSTTYYYRVCASDDMGLVSSGSTASGVPQGAAVKVYHNQSLVHDDTSIQAAYAAASSSDTIKTRATSFFESLIFDTKPISFEGGYDTTYSSITGRATVVGSLTISGGAVTIGSGSLVLQSSKVP